MTHGTRGIGNVNGDIMTILKIYVCTKKDITYVPDVGTNILGRMNVKMPSQNIYDYKKITPLDTNEIMAIMSPYVGNVHEGVRTVIRTLVNKINELTIEQNHLMKDFELYKKAHQRHVGKNQAVHE